MGKKCHPLYNSHGKPLNSNSIKQNSWLTELSSYTVCIETQVQAQITCYVTNPWNMYIIFVYCLSTLGAETILLFIKDWDTYRYSNHFISSMSSAMIPVNPWDDKLL